VSTPFDFRHRVVSPTASPFPARHLLYLSILRPADAIDVCDWLSGTTSQAVSEKSVGLSAYAKVLTVLTSGTIGLEEEDEIEGDEDDLIESSTRLAADGLGHPETFVSRVR
jgi:hypothetical protein